MVFRYLPPTLTSNLLHRHLENPMQTLEAMLRPKVATLPGHIQAVYVQNAAKLFATVLKSQEGNTDSTAAQETSQLLIDRLPVFVQSANLEVQERVRWIDFFCVCVSCTIWTGTSTMHPSSPPSHSPVFFSGILHPAAGQVHPEAAAEGRGGGRGSQRSVCRRTQPRGPQGPEEGSCS